MSDLAWLRAMENRVDELSADLRQQGIAEADRLHLLELGLNKAEPGDHETQDYYSELILLLGSRSRLLLHVADRIDAAVVGTISLVPTQKIPD